MDELETRPKVSVCVVAYNQLDFIRQCLASILSQQTSFPFEVVVGDDCSTDGTRAVVQEYADRFPGQVRLLFHEKNVGPSRNYGSVHALARGELIAHMDGDDYMLPGKLQAQADGLDAHPECSLCFHTVERFDPLQGRCIRYKQKPHPQVSDIAYLMMNFGYFVNSSKMYRAECRENIDLESKERIDCYVHIHHALRGKILYLPEVLGGYRLNSGIGTDKRDKRRTIYKLPTQGIFEKILDALEYARESGVDPGLVTRAEGTLYFHHAYSVLMAKDFDAFKKAIRQCAEIGGMTKTQRFFWALSGVPWALFLLVRSRALVKQVLAVR